METTVQENSAFDEEKAIEELVRGREFADRLMSLVEKPMESDGSKAREDLVNKILISFANALSMLGNTESDEVSQVLEGSLVWDGAESGKSFRSSTTKDRKTCYKRRKLGYTSTREDSPAPFEDGHAWRKYGQKRIIFAEHPRNYFRCTYKYDQKCKATKHVQKIQDDPPVFRTTYYGFHTCSNGVFSGSDNLIFDSSQPDDYNSSSSILLSFDNDDKSFIVSNPPMKQDMEMGY